MNVPTKLWNKNFICNRLMFQNDHLIMYTFDRLGGFIVYRNHCMAVRLNIKIFIVTAHAEKGSYLSHKKIFSVFSFYPRTLQCHQRQSSSGMVVIRLELQTLKFRHWLSHRL